MDVDKLIMQLEGLKTIGQGRWIARCPAHEDRSPSLSIRETDGKILLHCFAGCNVYEIVSAIGIELSDLFSDEISPNGSKPLSRPFPAADILKCLAFESLFLSVCAERLEKGYALTDTDKKRLHLATNRIHAACIAGGFKQ